MIKLGIFFIARIFDVEELDCIAEVFENFFAGLGQWMICWEVGIYAAFFEC
jgi:hypothetical protein